MNNDIDNTEPDWLQVSKLKDLVAKLESTISTLGKELNACRKQLVQSELESNKDSLNSNHITGFPNERTYPPDPTGMQYPVWKGPYVPPTQLPPIHIASDNLSHLDQVAMAAMQGLLQSYIYDLGDSERWSWLVVEDTERKVVWNKYEGGPGELATLSYEIASAMLKRSKQIQQGE